MQRILLLLVLALCLVPLTAAEEGGNSTSDEPSGSEDANGCDISEINGPAPGRPVAYWVILDPDGCYRELVDRVLPWILRRP